MLNFANREAYREPPARVGRRVGPTGHVTTIEESCAGIHVCLSTLSLSVCLLSLKQLWAVGSQFIFLNVVDSNT